MKHTMLTKYIDPYMSRHDSIPNPWKISTDVFKFDNDLWTEFFGLHKNPVLDRVSHRLEETDSEMKVAFDLPGVAPGDIEVSVVGRRLLIDFKLRDKKRQLDYGVGSDYDVGAGTARLEHGVLELRFPRTAKSKPKKIDIEVK